MRLEGFSKRGMELGNDPEGIKETKNDLRKQYLNAISRLALEKMQNDILFEGKLRAAIRNLSSLGLNVTREDILKDIEIEIIKQKTDFNWNDTQFFDSFDSIPISDKLPKTDSIDDSKLTIENLKNNLDGLFGDPSPSFPTSVTPSSSISSKSISQSTTTNNEISEKNRIISQIINAMNNAGELSFENISMDERMNIMQNIQNKLSSKSIDELQTLLSSYLTPNIPEDTISNQIHM